MKHVFLRAYVPQMLRLAKSVQLASTQNPRYSLICSQLAVNLRRGVPRPWPVTTLWHFLEQTFPRTRKILSSLELVKDRKALNDW